MSMRHGFVVGSVVVVSLFAACGGSSSSTSGGIDAGPDGPDGLPDPTTACGACVQNACCNPPPQPDDFAHAYRCAGGKWQSDDTCLPVAACITPATGSLTGANGKTSPVSCIEGSNKNGVPSITLRISAREVVEIIFDLAPRAGDVVQFLPFDESQSFPGGGDGGSDGGASRYGMFRIGEYGGFGGFAVSARSASGTLKVISVDAPSPLKITSLHGTLDAKTTGAGSGAVDPWAGSIQGSW